MRFTYRAWNGTIGTQHTSGYSQDPPSCALRTPRTPNLRQTELHQPMATGPAKRWTPADRGEKLTSYSITPASRNKVYERKSSQ